MNSHYQKNITTRIDKKVYKNLMERNRMICKVGGYRFEGGIYVGYWNTSGLPEGIGSIKFSDGTQYCGYFQSGKFNGMGLLIFTDGSKYEGEFKDGWFHGYGVFWRSDGMKHEGEFRGGKIWGLGATTFKDHSTGFPRMEGYFKEYRLLRKKSCPEVVHRAQFISYFVREQIVSSL